MIWVQWFRPVAGRLFPDPRTCARKPEAAVTTEQYLCSGHLRPTSQGDGRQYSDTTHDARRTTKLPLRAWHSHYLSPSTSNPRRQLTNYSVCGNLKLSHDDRRYTCYLAPGDPPTRRPICRVVPFSQDELMYEDAALVTRLHILLTVANQQ